VIGFLFSGLVSAGSRAAGLALAVAVWLLSRPGGWAVLVILVLLWLRWFPQATSGIAAP
jgi:hypothetical protein